jgi:6-phosphogluconolactonase (cycloisomerase 2 family)
MKFTKFGKALLVSTLSAGVVLSLASCVQSYTVGFLYVTGTTTAQPNGNGIITGFKIDHNTGKLKAINQFPISSGGANPVRAVLISGSRFFYVLNKGVNSAGNGNCTTDDPCKNSNITQFAVGGNGILTAQETFFTKGINPFRLLTDTSGNYLFVLDHDAPSSAACKLALGSSATTCGDVTVYQINSTTGRLQLVVNAQVTSAGGSPLPYFPVPANPIDFALTNGFLLTVSGAPATGDAVFPYSYNAGNGQLTVNQNSAQPLSISEVTAIVNGSGTVYVLDNEPITKSGSVVSQSQVLPYTVGSNGALQAQEGGAVPDDPTQANPISLLVESKGKWVYVANQGNNNTTTGDAASGITGYILTQPFQMTEMPGLPFGTGAGPQCIVEDPSDQFVYTANFNDSTVSGKAIDENAGVLNPLRSGTSSFPLNGPATWCVINGRTS